MGGATKKVATNPKTVVGGLAAPFTGGSSLLLAGAESSKDYKKQQEKEKKAELEREAKKQEKQKEEERRKTKMASLASRAQKTSGIASLVGGEEETLG